MLRQAVRGGTGWVLRLSARAQLFAAGVLFGLMAALARLASGGAEGFTATQLSTVRFGVGALACLALFAARRGTFRPVKHRLLLTRGLLGGLAALLYFVSLARIPAGEATLLNNTAPIFAIAIAVVTLGERPTLHLALALALASVGVFCVLGETGELQLGWGEAAGIASAVLAAGAIASIRALRPTDNAPTIFFAFCLGGFAVSVPFAFGPWPGDAGGWALAVAVGLVSVGAQLLLTHSLGFLSVPEAAIWVQLTPVASYLWALPLLDERLSALGVFGVLLVVGGVAWGAIFGARSAGEAQAAKAASTSPT